MDALKSGTSLYLFGDPLQLSLEARQLLDVIPGPGGKSLANALLGTVNHLFAHDSPELDLMHPRDRGRRT